MNQIKESGGIQYIEHTSTGTRQGTPDGPTEFHLQWVAPEVPQGAVLFNAAGNAADSSGDPNGDFIYTASAYSRTSEGPSPSHLSRGPAPERREEVRLTETSKLLNLPNPVDMNKGTVEFHIQHRFFRALKDSGPGRAFGIDSGANISLGLSFGLTDRLSVGVSRARLSLQPEGAPPFGTTAFTGTYELYNRPDKAWKASLLTGLEGQQNFKQHYSPFLQLASTWSYESLRLHFVPTVIWNSRNDEQAALFARAVNPENNHTLSLGMGADYALNRRFSLLAEYVPRAAGFGGFDDDHPTLSGGVGIRTWGHVFTVLVSSSRDFTVAEYGVNAKERVRDLSLGFNIYRRLR